MLAMTRFCTLTTFAIGSLAMGTVASANGINVPAQQQPVVVDPRPARGFPAIFGVASAIPPANGTASVAFTYADPRGGVAGSDSDGDLSFGYTFGNPIDNLSVSVHANITGLEPFGDSGNFDISISRMLHATPTGVTFVGASAGQLGAFGSATVDDESYSIYLSHIRGIETGAGEFPVQFTFGYGTEITRADDGSGLIDEGLFYGVGVGLTPNFSLSLSGTETQFNLGATLTVDAIPGLSISGGVYDVSNATSRQQTALTVAFSF